MYVMKFQVKMLKVSFDTFGKSTVNYCYNIFLLVCKLLFHPNHSFQTVERAIITALAVNCTKSYKCYKLSAKQSKKFKQNLIDFF